MRSVAIETLKDHVDEFVRAAEAGETVLVTDHDRVVAELRPPTVDPVASWNARRAASGGPPLDAFEEQGVREGWLTPASEFGPLGFDRSIEPSGITFEQLMDDLAKDREDR